MKTIVFSGINLFEGGPLSVFKDCLNSIVENKIYEQNKIIAFVHKREMFKEYIDKIEIIELPRSRKNYIYRLWYEYIYFYLFSRKMNIDIWFSLHDITPNVKSKKRYVYCHNAAPFYKMSKFEIKLAPKLRLFNLFYKYLYAINIKKNDYVIVQQSWIKEKFKDLFGVNKVLVAYPSTSQTLNANKLNNNNEDIKMFFYPSFPRVFKNSEVICEASKILVNKGITNFKVVLTLDGSENKYSKYIVDTYKSIKNISFVGLLSREEVYRYYAKSNCLLFPSKLETWGLPITEYKAFNKPIIIADLDYAKETLGCYNKAYFFNPDKAEDLASILERTINGSIKWNAYNSLINPDSRSWKELFDILF